MLVQYFGIQVSRHLFVSRTGRFLASDIPLRRRDAAGFGLAPVWIYTLGVDGLPARHVEISIMESPANPLRFLIDAWRHRLAAHGMPDVMRLQEEVDRRLPALKGALHALEIRSSIVDERDGSFAGRLRLSQGDAGMALCYPWKRLSAASGFGDINRVLAAEGDALTRYIFAKARPAALGALGRDHMIQPPGEDEVGDVLSWSDNAWKEARCGRDLSDWFAIDQAAIAPRSELDLVGEGSAFRWLTQPGDAPDLTTEHWHASEIEEAQAFAAGRGR